VIGSFTGDKYIPAHIEVLKSGLTIPTPARFTPHLRNVNNALNGTGVLYDANGNLIEGEKLENYAGRLNYNCWVWLNAGFPKGTGFLGLNLATITGLDEEDKPIIKVAPLEDCLKKDGWADLGSLNNQGLPTKRAPVDKYEPGKTIYFYSPRQDAVARFDAGSDWANLSCGGYPTSRDGSLGVFTSAEGSPEK